LKTHPLIFAERPWLKKVVPHSSERGKIYTYGVTVLQSMCRTFYKKNKHLIPKFHQDYEPNPWEYQYDLEMFIFLNYKKISDMENIRMHGIIRKEQEKGEDANEELIEKCWKRLDSIKENGVTGLPREEHWWNAAEIRWPTNVTSTGEHRGQMLRDPWAQKRIQGLTKGYEYIFTMGGGMQGKTHTYCGFMLTMFDYFVHTQRGAKCSFSTTSEQKLKTAAWPAITRLISSSQKDCSLVIGQSVVAGDFTIKREGNRNDTGGVIKGILLGKSINEAEVIDKLTGAHGHPCYVYLIDEIQSTPQAPIKASRNFLLTGSPAWIIGAGNYDTDEDSLGVNVKPKDGWESVDHTTGEWISKSIIGKDSLVQHYNNSLSPAYLDDDMAKRYPHLPNKKKEKNTYETSSERDISNNEYRRFWLGWRSTEFDPNSALNHTMVRSSGADQPLDIDKKFARTYFFSLDTNKAQGDRARILVCCAGLCALTRIWIWGVVESIEIPLIDDVRRLNVHVVKEVLSVCRRYGIDEGIMDWSDMSSVYADLSDAGLNVMPLIYHANVPDGKTIDKYTKRRDQAIVINANTNTYGHQKCANRITLGAYAVREYCKNGKLKGINDDLLGVSPSSNRKLSDELFLRKIETVTRANSATGSLMCLDSKEDFKRAHRFSPDIFDCLAQAGYYVLAKIRIPIHDDYVPDKIANSNNQADSDDNVNNFELEYCCEYL